LASLNNFKFLILLLIGLQTVASIDVNAQVNKGKNKIKKSSKLQAPTPPPSQPEPEPEKPKATVRSVPIKVIPYLTVLKEKHPFQSDCRNILREPSVSWEDVQVTQFPDQEVSQITISGRINENLNIRFWSKSILLFDAKGKAIKPVVLPEIGFPLSEEGGKFLISINIPKTANSVSVPLELYGEDQWRYYVRISRVREKTTVTAAPILDKGFKDFCSREFTWVGYGIMGAIQKQATTPIVTSLDLQSFSLDTLVYERRWLKDPDHYYRLFLNTGTFVFNKFLGTSGSERSFVVQGDMTFTKRDWKYKHNLFRAQYGYLLGGVFERRPFAIVTGYDTGSIGVGMHVMGSVGGYLEVFPHNNKWYTDVSLRLHPIYLGVDHSYSGLGFSGSIGIAKPLPNDRMFGFFAYGTMFSGNEKRSDIGGDNEVFIFQSHLEFRYGWLL
jgi:hypothetical protein